MKIKRLIIGGLETNGYIIYQKEGGDCYVIDPGYNADKFIKFMKENKLNIIGILLTHHHYDHVGAVKKIKELTECPVYLHRNDLDMYKGHVDVVMEDGDTIKLEEEVIKVLHTPGHTQGSVCLFSEKSKLVFTGDTIFNVDLGRTDLSDGDQYKMLATMKNIVNLWDNEIMIHPGHGDPCNMKFVRKENREFIDAIEM
jgi:glyoxylase-like metal-dependent hydrolase (beta-lactamase superfamily II)